ncbi:MAG: AraC family transcriptional regulator [Erysipelotrichaceae bacterium]
MYKKTTSIQCAKYCEILKKLPKNGNSNYFNAKKTIKKKIIDELYVYDRSVYVQVENGIVGIIFLNDLNHKPELFAIHKTLKIKPGTYFNFISLSQTGAITMQMHLSANSQKVRIPEFGSNGIKSSIKVQEIYAYYYSTKGNSYFFEGEKHPYWEMTFVDNGELITNVEGTDYILPPRSVFFYGPHQFHTQRTTDKNTCSYMTIMFEMKDMDPNKLSNRVIQCSKNMFQTLSMFMHLSNEKWEHINELLLSLLKLLIIYAMDETNEIELSNQNINPMQQHYEDELMNEITQYIMNHINSSLTINEICDKFAISRSSLQALFKRNLDISPKHYINNIKLEQSKILLKNSARTVSEVSDMLGFASIHYFSRKFKLQYGIAPSEYAKSIVN